MNDFKDYIKNNRSVLIIDDCEIYRFAVKNMLEKMGFDSSSIYIAHDAATAMKIAENKSLKLIICDYNLGHKVNGTDVLTHLISTQLIDCDCVLVVVTADASKQVLNKFAELEPDGYIIKPLNYNTLLERLPKWVLKKHLLGDLLKEFNQGNYQSVLDSPINVENLLMEHRHHVTLLRGQAELHLGHLESATKLLTPLQSTILKNAATLSLTQVSIRQGKLSHLNVQLSSLSRNEFLFAKALQLKAEISFRENNYDEARAYIEKSIARSPNNFQRQMVRIHIAVAQGDHEYIIHSINNVQSLNCFKNNKSSDFYIEYAGLLLNGAESSLSTDLRNSYLKCFAELTAKWRKTYDRNTTLMPNLALLARFNFILGKVNDARHFLSSYALQTKINKDHKPSVIEHCQWLKLNEQLKPSHDLDEWISYQKTSIATNYTSIKALAYFQEMTLWHKDNKRKNARVITLKQQAKVKFSNGNVKNAIALYVEAHKISRFDVDISQSIIETLTKSWPPGWVQQQVESLILRCINNLKNDKGKPLSQSVLKNYQTLQEQLSLPRIA